MGNPWFKVGNRVVLHAPDPSISMLNMELRNFEICDNILDVKIVGVNKVDDYVEVEVIRVPEQTNIH
jgi:hypothetical protein